MPTPGEGQAPECDRNSPVPVQGEEVLAGPLFIPG